MDTNYILLRVLQFHNFAELHICKYILIVKNEFPKVELELLTGDVVVCQAFEFKSHVVWTELLELDGEFDVFLWFVAGHQNIGVQYGAAGLGLFFLHQVEFIKLIRSPHFPFGADNVQFVTDFWVDHQALPRHKPATQKHTKLQ